MTDARLECVRQVVLDAMVRAWVLITIDGEHDRTCDALHEAVEAAGSYDLPVGDGTRQNGRGGVAERHALVPWTDFVGLVTTVLEGGR